MLPPEGLSLRHDRDLEGRERHPLTRRVLIGLLALFLTLGLLGVFGQRPHRSSADGPAATLEVSAPTKLRGGLYFQARFDVLAREEIGSAALVLADGWFEGMTLNTAVPAPLEERSRGGGVEYVLGRIPAGETQRLYLQFQVNPTRVGRGSQDVTLLDGGRVLASVDRTVTVWP